MIALIIRVRHKLIFGVSRVQILDFLLDDKILPIELTKTHNYDNVYSN